MLRKIGSISLIAGLMISAASIAQTPASAPAGSTGLCRDGTYWTGATKRGACHGHKGVQDWYATDGAAATGSAAPAAAAPAATAAPAPAAAPASAPAAAASPAAPAATKHSSSSWTPPATPAAGGGPGLVWVNTSSNVYHCQADKWYGKTKNGAYMSEADAKAKGARPDHGKACQ
jgi:Protein of unknown function (DUF3761)